MTHGRHDRIVRSADADTDANNDRSGRIRRIAGPLLPMLAAAASILPATANAYAPPGTSAAEKTRINQLVREQVRLKEKLVNGGRVRITGPMGVSTGEEGSVVRANLLVGTIRQKNGKTTHPLFELSQQGTTMKSVTVKLVPTAAYKNVSQPPSFADLANTIVKPRLDPESHLPVADISYIGYGAQGPQPFVLRGQPIGLVTSVPMQPTVGQL